MGFCSVYERSVKAIAMHCFTSGDELELTTFAEKFFREEFGQGKRGPAAEEN